MEKEYICGCGKAYGSYPAFSTHRKLKHSNETIQGTLIPSQEKARRGRPSYDFKKVPTPNDEKKRHYQGLTVIEFGLLDLEELHKGKIIGDAHSEINVGFPHIEAHCEEADARRVSFIRQFASLLTRHMTQAAAENVIAFLQILIEFGLENKALTEMSMYNSLFKFKSKEFEAIQYGFKYYAQICVILAKWLCVMGEATSSLSAQLSDVALPL